MIVTSTHVEKSDTRSYETHARSCNINEILQQSDKKIVVPEILDQVTQSDS